MAAVRFDVALPAGDNIVGNLPAVLDKINSLDDVYAEFMDTAEAELTHLMGVEGKEADKDKELGKRGDFLAASIGVPVATALRVPSRDDCRRLRLRRRRRLDEQLQMAMPLEYEAWL